MSKREPGLDLLRCIALLFVVTFHSFLNNGYYSESQVGISMWLAGSFRWLSVSCMRRCRKVVFHCNDTSAVVGTAAADKTV